MRAAKIQHDRETPVDNAETALRILSFGYAPRELTSKHEALAAVGFTVVSSSELSAVKSMLKKEGRQFRFFLIGPTVPARQRAALAELFRKLNSQGMVVFFYHGSINNAEQATAVLSETGSPSNLIDAIYSLLGHTELPQRRMRNFARGLK
jgi:hypothetical protein